MAARTYGRLMAGGGGDPFDRHLFACATTLALGERRPLAAALGLAAEDLAALVGAFFPHVPELLTGVDPDRDCGLPLTAEEEGVRDLLLRHRAVGSIEEYWLAHVIARRSLSGRLLWQDLGLSCRGDLSLILATHFTPLATLNHSDMRWKPFFRRQLELETGLDCQREVSCDNCRRQARCFGPEPGTSLILATHLP